MNYEELLVYLNIDEPSEFIYFEQMADLIESEEFIEQEAVFGLLQEADKETVSTLFDQYFEEITNALPDDSDEIYSLLDQIRLCLIGLTENAEDDSDYRMLADEFCKFRDWYVYDSQVEVISDDDIVDCESVRDAITSARVDKLRGEEHSFNFDQALNFEIDGYTMSFAELASFEEDDDEEE